MTKERTGRTSLASLIKKPFILSNVYIVEEEGEIKVEFKTISSTLVSLQKQIDILIS